MQCARNNQPRGNQELSQTSTLIFARAGVSAEMLEKGDFFSQPFVNQIGRFTLSLEHDGEIFQPAVWLQLDVWCLIVGGLLHMFIIVMPLILRIIMSMPFIKVFIMHLLLAVTGI